MQISNGKEQINIEVKQDHITVFINKGQYDESALAIINKYVNYQENEEGLEIQYPIKKGMVSLENAILRTNTRLDKLQLAQTISLLLDTMNGFQIPFMHPALLFLDGETIQVMHCGLLDCLVPKSYDTQLLLQNYRALILSIFNKKLPYEKLIKGSIGQNDTFSIAIHKCKSVDEINTFICEQLRIEKDKVRKTKSLVPKRSYILYRTVGIFGIVIAILASGFWYYNERQKTRQGDIIAAQTSFLTNNYARTQSDLSSYTLASLPKSARYVLAVSAIQLTDLTAKQKQAILNTISVKSDDNSLNYWVSMGRGNFEDALDLAQNLGDDQLTLLAYTDLYQATRINNKMNGAKKQKLLEEYTKKIDELTKKLGE